MTPAIIAHYLVAIAVIAVFLTIALYSVRPSFVKPPTVALMPSISTSPAAPAPPWSSRRTGIAWPTSRKLAASAISRRSPSASNAAPLSLLATAARSRHDSPRALVNRLALGAAALAVAALAAGAAASSVDLTAGAYTVAVVKLAAGCALSALFASLSGALFDAAED